MDKHLAEAQEEDIGECEGDTYTDIPANAAATFFRRERHTHNRQDESGERESKTGILLDQSHLHIGISSHLLDTYHLVQFIIIHRLDSLFIKIEILDTQRNNRIHLSSATDIVGQILVIVSDKIFLQPPALPCRIIYGSLGRYLRNELVVLYPFQSEAVGRIVPGAE